MITWYQFLLRTSRIFFQNLDTQYELVSSFVWHIGNVRSCVHVGRLVLIAVSKLQTVNLQVAAEQPPHFQSFPLRPEQQRPGVYTLVCVLHASGMFVLLVCWFVGFGVVSFKIRWRHVSCCTCKESRNLISQGTWWIVITLLRRKRAIVQSLFNKVIAVDVVQRKSLGWRNLLSGVSWQHL